MTIPWIQYTELVVGQNHPTLQDVENRPLEFVITASGLSPSGSFPGFIPIGASIPASTITGLNSVLAGYLALQGGTMTGQIKGKGYLPNIVRPGASPYTATAADEIIWMTAANLTINLPLSTAGGCILFIDPLGDLGVSPLFTLTVNTQGADVMSGPGLASNITSFTYQQTGANLYFIPISGTGWLVMGVGTQGFPVAYNDVNGIASNNATRFVYIALTAARNFTLPAITLQPYASFGPQSIELWDASGNAGAHNVTAFTAEGASTKINGVAGNVGVVALNANWQKRTFIGNIANIGGGATNWVMF